MGPRSLSLQWLGTLYLLALRGASAERHQRSICPVVERSSQCASAVVGNVLLPGLARGKRGAAPAQYLSGGGEVLAVCLCSGWERSTSWPCAGQARSGTSAVSVWWWRGPRSLS